jgi:hypothetical protein
MRWDELDSDAQRILLKLADDLLKAEKGLGRPARCAACYYWRAWQRPLEDSLKSDASGECLRRAPRDDNGFPITRSDDWCGESARLTTIDLARRIWAERQKMPDGGE